MISRIHDNEVDDIVNKIYELRENMIYMIGYKKMKENKY